MMTERPLAVTDFKKMKEQKTRITVLTAYDACFAYLLDESGIDMVLVGDSLANVFQGRNTTLPVTIEQMIYHGEIVARSVKRAFVAIDMPFMSFQVSPEDALRNAGRMVKETGCRAVKVEGGTDMIETIRHIVKAGIPVIGHVGMTPQSVNVFGGYGLRGKQNRSQVIEDAVAVEEAGAFAVVLEKIPKELAAEITGKLSIPTIGIGAGPECDGQVLVGADMLGLFSGMQPRFVRRYAELGDAVREAFRRYIDDVRSGAFPSDKESYSE
ncbi:MAG: 3-methyl-2-oxobutanoate hydroxymethyltransferase [Candidatus Latescibacterota bacterium]